MIDTYLEMLHNIRFETFLLKMFEYCLFRINATMVARKWEMFKMLDQKKLIPVNKFEIDGR